MADVVAERGADFCPALTILSDWFLITVPPTPYPSYLDRSLFQAHAQAPAGDFGASRFPPPSCSTRWQPTSAQELRIFGAFGTRTSEGVVRSRTLEEA